jgi:hypothetical protein
MSAPPGRVGQRETSGGQTIGWRDQQRSDNVEDLRGEAAPRVGLGGGSPLGRMLPLLIQTRIGRTLLIFGALIYFGARFLGIDLLQLASGPNPTGAPGAQAPSAQDQELADFVSVVLADTEKTWHQQFAERNANYVEPKLVLFRGAVRSACGLAQLGTSTKVHEAQQRASQVQANQLSARLELQADCYAGIWGHYADRERHIVEMGDLEEAINAASAIDDDTLQRQAGGQVRPESFTQGTAQQRME